LSDILAGSIKGLKSVTEIDYLVYMYVEEIDVITQSCLLEGEIAPENKLKELEELVVKNQNLSLSFP